MLALILEPQSHPYRNSPKWKYELWGKILFVYSDKIIFEGEWNILELLEWFLEREDSLIKDVFPFNEMGQLSLAEKFNLHRNELANIDEELDSDYYDDILSEYWEAHYFILRGSIFPRFLLGVNNDIGELSYLDNESAKYVRFRFDMRTFIDDVYMRCKEAITEWYHKDFTQECFDEILALQNRYVRSFI